MKWMSWGPSDYDEAPPEMIRRIEHHINEEREEYERIHNER